MAPSSGELWGHHLMPPTITVDCLMPTGIIIPLTCVRDATLETVKTDLWQMAKRYPLYNLLAESTLYIFVSITQDAEKEEFYDESRRLCDLRLFQPILKVVEPKGNKEEKMLNSEIGLAIGMPVHEFDEMKDTEVIEFRRSILNVCKEAVEARDSGSEDKLASYVYPPEIESMEELPSNLEKKLDKGLVIVCVWVLSPTGEKQKYTVKVSKHDYPESITQEAILKKLKCMKLTKEQQQKCAKDFQRSYLLKICGIDQYLLERFPITQYKYIRNCIAKGDIPQLMLMSKEGVHNSLPRCEFHMPSFLRRAPPVAGNQQTMSLWNVDTMLRIQILWATYVNVRDIDKVYVKTGIFHGTEPLCDMRYTKHVVFSNPKWKEWLEYDIYVPDIPRSARLCLSICSVTRRKRREVILLVTSFLVRAMCTNELQFVTISESTCIKLIFNAWKKILKHASKKLFNMRVQFSYKYELNIK